MKNKRIGFACKWIEPQDASTKQSSPDLSTKTTTLTWLNKQSKTVAYNKLEQLMLHNLSANKKLVSRVAQLPQMLRMVRLSSEVLPVYTADKWSEFYHAPSIQNILQQELLETGNIARAHGVRLSFHPGQFTVLASENPVTVTNSIREFEYHVMLAEMMGYAKQFQDFKINVHISGRLGPNGILQALKRLSVGAQRTITIENEEMTYGIDDCLRLCEHVPIVLDLHHHWIHSHNYIQPEDPRISQIIQSWRGIRPVLHYSVSKQELLSQHSEQQLPDYALLTESGFKKTQLRAHSDYYWNHAVNQYALQFLEHFDIMCESKCKNLASGLLYDQYCTQTFATRPEVWVG